jgi:hypothetical protein
VVAPWVVANIAFDADRHRLDIQVGSKRGARFACPEGDRDDCPVHDHLTEKEWRHINFFDHEVERRQAEFRVTHLKERGHEGSNFIAARQLQLALSPAFQLNLCGAAYSSSAPGRSGVVSGIQSGPTAPAAASIAITIRMITKRFI